MTDVLITGDSHTAALFRGQAAIRADAAWPEAIRMTIRPLGGGHLTREPFFVDRGDHAQITNPEYRRHFERLPLVEPDGRMVVYGLSAPLHSVRIWRHADWQKFVPSLTHLPGIPVSSALIRRIVLDDQRYCLDLIRILLRNHVPVFVVEAPRPFRHHPALQRGRPEIILHLDRLYRQIIRQSLQSLGVPVIDVPEHCLDNGFMRQDYMVPGDSHHGNAAYGRIMIEATLDFLLSPQGAEWRAETPLPRPESVVEPLIFNQAEH